MAIVSYGARGAMAPPSGAARRTPRFAGEESSLRTGNRQLDGEPAPLSLALVIDEFGDCEIGGCGAIVVGVVGDLVFARAAGKCAAHQIAQLMDLVPADDALLQRFHEAGLLLLFDGFAPIGD